MYKVIIGSMCFSTLALLLGCSSTSSFMPAAGPTNTQLSKNIDQQNAIRIVDIQSDNYLAYSQQIAHSSESFFSPKNKPELRLGAGDVVQLSIWEAPPAVLFGMMGAGADQMGLSGGMLNLPDQVIGANGHITVPFVGNVRASGRTLEQIQQTVRNALAKIANQPQVVARLSQNNSNTVSLIADRKSTVIPLTHKGERLLDVMPLIADLKLLKSASLVVERAQHRFVVRADDLTRNQHNIYLYPGDTVRVLQDQYEVSVLGATNSNTILNFGDNGLSLAELIAKTSGMNDFRADPKGVFLFRKANSQYAIQGQSGEVLRFDLSSAEGIMIAQNFQVKDKDLLYVSNAGGTELQKFLSIIGSILSPVSSTRAMTQ